MRCQSLADSGSTRRVCLFLIFFLSSTGLALATREVLSPGLQIAVRMDSTISTKDQQYHYQYFSPILTGTLDQDIVTGDGRVAVPAGSTVKLAISDFRRAGRVTGRARLRLRLYSMVLADGSEVPLDGYPTMGSKPKADKEGTFHGKHGLIKDAAFDFTFIAAGAGAGFAVGGPWGLPAGAAGGLLTACIWTVARRGPDLTIPAGTVLSFTLGRPASVWLPDRIASSNPVGSRSSLVAYTAAPTGAPSPCAAWGCEAVVPPSRDLLDLLEQTGDPKATLEYLDHVNFHSRPDTDHVFVAYLRGVNELRLSHPKKAVDDLKEAYQGAKSLNLPFSAQTEIARNLVLALKESSSNWEASPLMQDPTLQAALVQPAGVAP
jgi:hypothetical protein